MVFGNRKKAGVIGLGIIGSRVAKNLSTSRFQTFVWNRTPKPFPNFLPSPAEVAETCDIIQIFVADPPALEEVIAQLQPVLGKRHVVLNHATVSFEATAGAEAMITACGAAFLDAPFTGSREAAENRGLVYYIGGSDAALEKARPVLEASSRLILRAGGIGEATVLKIAMNTMIANQMQAMTEALALARAHGITPDLFTEALANNAARSGVSDMKLGKILAGDFDTHFSARHMFKDLQFGLDLAEKARIELPATRTSAASLMDAVTNGDGNLDFSVIARQFPDIVGTVETAPEPPAPTEEPPAPTEEPPAPAEEPHDFALPPAPAEEPPAPAEEPPAPAEEPHDFALPPAPAEEPPAPAEEPPAPAEEPPAPAEEPPAPAEEPPAPAEEPPAPTEEPPAPAEEPPAPAEEPPAPAEEPPAPAEEPPAPTEEPHPRRTSQRITIFGRAGIIRAGKKP